jgi:type VI secretion system protein ImpK
MHLLDYFANVFVETELVLSEISQQQKLSYEVVLTRLEKQLNTFGTKYRNDDYTDQAFQNAKFAVVGYIDEQLLSSGWDGKEEWKKGSLQNKLFSTLNSGVEFYDRLDALNPLDPMDREVRSVYYTCLCRGFQGKYFMSGHESFLSSIRDTNLNLLVDTSGQRALFPEGEPVKNMAKSERKLSLSAFIYGLPLILFLALFFWMRGEILSYSKSLANAL